MNKRTMISGMLALSMLAYTAPAVTTSVQAQSISLSLDGQPVQFTVLPAVVNGTTMVPLRDLSVALEALIRWDESKQTAEAEKDGQIIRLTVGSKEAYRNGRPVKLEQAPVMSSGRLLVPLRFFSESFDFKVDWNSASQSVALNSADRKLPTVGSFERMVELLQQSSAFASNSFLALEKAQVAMDASASAAPAAAVPESRTGESGHSAPADYSGTNVQVQGVDEADIIKTDGQYIYQVNRATRQIVVANAVPAEQMSVVDLVYFSDRQFNPLEMYVDEQHLVVVGNSYYPGNNGGGYMPYDSASSAADDLVDPVGSTASLRAPLIKIAPDFGRSTTKAIIFDLSDKSNIRQIREVELEGYYVSSRKIGSAFYFITNKSIPYSYTTKAGATAPEIDPAAAAPAYRDSLESGDSQFKSIPYQDIYYFPKAVEPNYLLVGGINLDEPERKMEVASYLGSGSTVYASQDRLYVAATQYETTAQPGGQSANPDQPVSSPASRSLEQPGTLPATSTASPDQPASDSAASSNSGSGVAASSSVAGNSSSGLAASTPAAGGGSDSSAALPALASTPASSNGLTAASPTQASTGSVPGAPAADSIAPAIQPSDVTILPVTEPAIEPMPIPMPMPMPVVPPQPLEMSTVVYAFSLNDGNVQYVGRGKVPGRVLNQFSMDEHNGYFRIATTKGDMWRNDEHTSKNNMYVLDSSMNIVGKLEDIAPGEQIYSVRYAGGRAYMVTFKKVDPLFVIDLQDPRNPHILGKLKIPGYSDYLHPYDENHLIGFGKDAVEVANEFGFGSPDDTTAYYQGMKLSLFDVSDVANPKELFTEMIGDRGTYSDVLHNHKALLFSKEKNIMVFPVTLMEVSNKTGTPKDAMQYGEFTFQGAYVYGIDLTNGFQLRGKITHMTDEELLKAGQTWVPYNRAVERALYIGDTLYTASQGLIKANRLTTLEETGALRLPEGTDR